jgi:dTDP-3-amino-3,4,6-trideoxy-alpha-D-glucopyranose N,N-dimethyltransferase
MYVKSARFYDAIYHFKDYESECDKLHDLIQQHNPSSNTLLDVACGSGKHIEHLMKYYDAQGLDINPDLLAIARKRCPGVKFHQGDMVTFDLGQEFDVITCLFSSISCVKTYHNLLMSVDCMARHLHPGGIIFAEAWFSPDNYRKNEITANFVDEPDLKIAWMYKSEAEGTLSFFNMNYMVGTPEGVTYFTEVHEMGLFTHAEYSQAFTSAGLSVGYDTHGLFGRGMYIATKPA